MIRTRFATVTPHDWGCVVRFDDGSEVPAQHHPDDPRYIAVAHRLGYDGDTLAYCREHEVCHLVLCETLHDAPSLVLWCLAHGAPLSASEAAYEELCVQALQGWVRARQRPFVALPWDEMGRRVEELMG